MLQAVLSAYEELPHLRSRGKFQGVELVPGWVKFASSFFESKYANISFVVGDITEFSLDPSNQTFDFVMLNDVVEHLQQHRYGCFFDQLKSVTHKESIVYMHTPTPHAQLFENGQYYENLLPHHILIAGMAAAGFELVTFEHDLDTKCGGDLSSSAPLQLQRGECSVGGWIKYYHATFIRRGGRELFST